MIVTAAFPVFVAVAAMGMVVPAAGVSVSVLSVVVSATAVVVRVGTVRMIVTAIGMSVSMTAVRMVVAAGSHEGGHHRPGYGFARVARDFGNSHGRVRVGVAAV